MLAIHLSTKVARCAWTHLVPVQDGKLDSIGILIPPNVEQELLVPNRVKLMPDDSGSEYLFAE